MERQEKVFDVACSDGLAVDPKSHRCPDNGTRVDAAMGFGVYRQAI